MLNVYSLRDNKAEAFNRPMYSVNDATITRELHAGVAQDPKLAAMAGDLTLYRIGSFNPDSGRLTPVDPVAIFDLNEIKQNSESYTNGEDTSTPILSA